MRRDELYVERCENYTSHVGGTPRRRFPPSFFNRRHFFAHNLPLCPQNSSFAFAIHSYEVMVEAIRRQEPKIAGRTRIHRAGDADPPFANFRLITEAARICAKGAALVRNGETGIRTPDTDLTPYNGLANRRLQPLGHLSRTSRGIILHATAERKAKVFRD